jgi:hypothetical protein
MASFARFILSSVKVASWLSTLFDNSPLELIGIIGLCHEYKLRNARLDRLSANPPPFLKNASAPLLHQDFTTVKTKEECKEVHDHLFLTLQLLERVIRARKLHTRDSLLKIVIMDMRSI